MPPVTTHNPENDTLEFEAQFWTTIAHLLGQIKNEPVHGGSFYAFLCFSFFF